MTVAVSISDARDFHPDPTWVPIQYGTGSLESVSLRLAVGVGAVGAACLLGLAFAAFLRRRSRSYLLVVGAVTALFGRSAIAGVAVMGHVPSSSHHLWEHGLDIILVALVIAAVYYARSVDRRVNTNQ